MGTTTIHTEGVLAALTALVRAINDADYEVVVQRKDDAPMTTDETEREIEKYTDDRQTSLVDFYHSKGPAAFYPAETNRRLYCCSNCGMSGHTMGNFNRPCRNQIRCDE